MISSFMEIQSESKKPSNKLSSRSGDRNSVFVESRTSYSDSNMVNDDVRKQVVSNPVPNSDIDSDQICWNKLLDLSLF